MILYSRHLISLSACILLLPTLPGITQAADSAAQTTSIKNGWFEGYPLFFGAGYDYPIGPRASLGYIFYQPSEPGSGFFTQASAGTNGGRTSLGWMDARDGLLNLIPFSLGSHCPVEAVGGRISYLRGWNGTPPGMGVVTDDPWSNRNYIGAEAVLTIGLNFSIGYFQRVKGPEGDDHHRDLVTCGVGIGF
jgi:hypothetical protein